MILFPILFLISHVYANSPCTINFCNGTHSSRKEVANFCQHEINEGSMKGRCCYNETETIVGLDLSSCSISNFNTSSNSFNFTDLIIMDLRDNQLEAIVPNDLLGLVNLDYLYLPNEIPCPGGKEAWNETQSNETFCYLQNNPCVYLNISCTDNGECIHLGPGSAKCVCKQGFYGYKCLNEGVFPTTVFSISLTIPTVILSILLWFAHGKDVYRRRITVQ